jgi:hypothetical protein
MTKSRGLLLLALVTLLAVSACASSTVGVSWGVSAGYGGPYGGYGGYPAPGVSIGMYGHP